ncbi:MAG: hypothetical protein K1X74_07585 [Pirellulales bacterium]|nr:hypothetical protein [Pirellulales bacterium]
MSISHLPVTPVDSPVFARAAEPEEESPTRRKRALHRIAEVRRQQGVSLRGVARQLKRTVSELKLEEDPGSDLHLSQLFQWQEALEVPVGELLEESDAPLSPPVLERARMVKIMKTAAAILEKADHASIRRLAQTLVDQLIEIMPELQGVNPWHAVGQRRTLDEFGRIVERRISSDLFREL